MTQVSETFASILRDGRDRFNARFAMARSMYPRLESHEFTLALVKIVEPLLAEWSRGNAPADRVRDAVHALYDRVLDLTGKDYLGHAGKYPGFEESLTQILHDVSAMLLAEPRRFSGSIANALYNLSRTTGARPEQWVADMLRIGDGATDMQTYLDMGIVSAWRAGMAHYRRRALEIAETLPVLPALRSLGVDFAVTPPDRLEGRHEEFLNTLKADAWRTPDAAARRMLNMQPEESNKPRPLLRPCGGFSGFGGLFITPPRIQYSKHGFLVDDREGEYLLYTDIFGSVFRRVRLELMDDGDLDSPNAVATQLRLDPGDGSIYDGTVRYDAPQLRGAVTWAAAGRTLCATHPASHQIFVIGFPATA